MTLPAEKSGGEAWHGTVDGYSSRGCRCDPCRAAKSARGKERHAEFKTWLTEIKSQPCADCGNSYPAVCMEFDHRDPSAKSFTIARSVTRSRKSVLTEIAKCDVVCANCHRLRTARQQADGLLTPGRPRKA